eukprot:CAMPEP_0204338150 /NCGR_PEP_ID=MMETSP0469-20131031/20860_1 /ASSEMBLY_ACC=CAM_ASM_000384 /TAXON_ID=2969 /ORGANISM="Oxyrrhis marina" /LENGTH=111 /DNA_ID=CAMNT_0051322287 /DNA_START=338 /DNA_END=673 /DNA_ORIENTATION=+
MRKAQWRQAAGGCSWLFRASRYGEKPWLWEPLEGAHHRTLAEGPPPARARTQSAASQLAQGSPLPKCQCHPHPMAPRFVPTSSRTALSRNPIPSLHPASTPPGPVVQYATE